MDEGVVRLHRYCCRAKGAGVSSSVTNLPQRRGSNRRASTNTPKKTVGAETKTEEPNTNSRNKFEKEKQEFAETENELLDEIDILHAAISPQTNFPPISIPLNIGLKTVSSIDSNSVTSNKNENDGHESSAILEADDEVVGILLSPKSDGPEKLLDDEDEFDCDLVEKTTKNDEKDVEDTFESTIQQQKRTFESTETLECDIKPISSSISFSQAVDTINVEANKNLRRSSNRLSSSGSFMPKLLSKVHRSSRVSALSNRLVGEI